MRLETVLMGDCGFESTALPSPVTSVHVPDPLTGVFPLRVTWFAQTVMSAPAFAIVVADETVAMTVSVVAFVHPDAEMVHTNW
jgi:hypothetical protein